MRLISLIPLGLLILSNLYVDVEPKRAVFKEKDESGCKFPFKIGKKTYTKCTKGDEDFPMCPYTDHFNGVWKYCSDQKTSKYSCKTPCVNYKGEEWPSCRSKNRNKKQYCTDKIKYLETSDSEALDPNCPERYKSTPYHTGCLKTSKYAVRIGLSDQDKKEIVDLHDQWRMAVEVPAKQMLKMYYDDDLAFVAQHHASRCSFGHDEPKGRAMGTGKMPGQNIVRTVGAQKANITKMFNMMFKAESRRFEYGVGTKAKYKKYRQNAGHYSQVILDHVTKLGCGYAECIYVDRREQFFVCNYDNMQFKHEMKSPYEKGAWCSGCPNNCVKNKLCDCGGKECMNGGKLDPGTCKCTCKGFWQGDKCETPIISEKQANGCMLPFMWKGELKYDCMPDPDAFYDYPVCSNAPVMTYNTLIECKK